MIYLQEDNGEGEAQVRESLPAVGDVSADDDGHNWRKCGAAGSEVRSAEGLGTCSWPGHGSGGGVRRGPRRRLAAPAAGHFFIFFSDL